MSSPRQAPVLAADLLVILAVGSGLLAAAPAATAASAPAAAVGGAIGGVTIGVRLVAVLVALVGDSVLIGVGRDRPTTGCGATNSGM